MPRAAAFAQRRAELGLVLWRLPTLAPPRSLARRAALLELGQGARRGGVARRGGGGGALGQASLGAVAPEERRHIVAVRALQAQEQLRRLREVELADELTAADLV